MAQGRAIELTEEPYSLSIWGTGVHGFEEVMVAETTHYTSVEEALDDASDLELWAITEAEKMIITDERGAEPVTLHTFTHQPDALAIFEAAIGRGSVG